jgi:uncharacterized damage-inducible protein DinB
MSLSEELASLLRRDLVRLHQQVQALPSNDELWQHAPGVTNSAGNLVLHLEGNLRHYIGLQLGKVPYQRDRPLEFSQTGLTVQDLAQRVEHLVELIPSVLAALSDADLEATYPEQVFSCPESSRQFVIHLHGHMNYHLGQIDYLRRFLTNDGAVAYARP